MRIDQKHTTSQVHKSKIELTLFIIQLLRLLKEQITCCLENPCIGLCINTREKCFHHMTNLFSVEYDFVPICRSNIQSVPNNDRVDRSGIIFDFLILIFSIKDIVLKIELS